MLFWTTLFSSEELSLNFWKEKQKSQTATQLHNFNEYTLSYIFSKCIFDHIFIFIFFYSFYILGRDLKCSTITYFKENP